MLAVAAMTIAGTAHAQVTLNFANADIGQVARALGAATGHTIIVDPRVKGTLNLIAERPVSEEEALKAMQAALRMQGFALVNDHGLLKVVTEADAKLQGVPTYVGNVVQARGDQVVTQVFTLRNESATNLLPILRPLISPNNTIAAYASNNTLVVTDYADNVRRIASIIAGVDRAAAQTIEIVPLANANAIDVAASAQKLLDPGAIGATDASLKVSVSADVRTNSVILRASNATRMEMAKRLVTSLDAPTREPGNIHVIPLKNASAVALAKTLRGMLGQGGSDSGADSGTGAKTSSLFGSDQNRGSGSGGLGSSSSSGLSGSVPPLPGGTGSSNNSALLGGSSTGDARSSSNASNDDNNPAGGMIQADAATNSLIVTASDPVYRNLRNVIDQLDARRAQIYIESLIAEVTTTNGAQLGIQWMGGALSSNGNGVVGGSSFNGSNSTGIVNLSAALAAAQGSTAAESAITNGVVATPTVQNGLNIGVLHRFGNILGVGGLLQALGTNDDVNVLSTPNLLTLDNEEAQIIVGQNVPFVSGSYATPSTSSTTLTAFNTYDRKDVGIMLHIKPQISQDGLIKLQIYQEDSSIVNGTGTQGGGYTINKRALQSTVLADNGQIVVLGGLLQDSYLNSNSKVPLLGDLPWIGNLFRTENKSRKKTNLMVFLRPVIVRDAQTSQEISQSRYDYMQQQSANYMSDNRLIRDSVTPLMPPSPDAVATTPGTVPQVPPPLIEPTVSRAPAPPAPVAPAAPPTLMSPNRDGGVPGFDGDRP